MNLYEVEVSKVENKDKADAECVQKALLSLTRVVESNET